MSVPLHLKLATIDALKIYKFMSMHIDKNIIEEFISKNETSSTETSIPFEDFWKKYDYKTGSKKTALTKWKALTDKEREEAMKGLDIYLKQRDPNFIAHATTWIWQKRREPLLEQEADRQKKEEEKRKSLENVNDTSWDFQEVLF